MYVRWSLPPDLVLIAIAAAFAVTAGCSSSRPPESQTPQPSVPETAAAPAPEHAAPAASGAADPPRAQTPGERRAALDKRPDDSPGCFDAKLRKEQQKSAQERDARPAAGTIAAGGPSPGRTGAATSGARGTSGGTRGTGAGTRGAGATTGNGATARPIPDGSDDDIVARRLRKAAEQETDPELKERLWKEYIGYKKDGQGT